MANENFSFPGNGALLVSWDFTKGRDNDLILVSGPEAMDIYKRLVTKVDSK